MALLKPFRLYKIHSKLELELLGRRHFVQIILIVGVWCKNVLRELGFPLTVVSYLMLRTHLRNLIKITMGSLSRPVTSSILISFII